MLGRNWTRGSKRAVYRKAAGWRTPLLCQSSLHHSHQFLVLYFPLHACFFTLMTRCLLQRLSLFNIPIFLTRSLSQVACICVLGLKAFSVSPRRVAKKALISEAFIPQVFPLLSWLWVIHLSYGQSKKYPGWKMTEIKYIPTIRSSWSNCRSYSTNFINWDMPISSILTSK